MIILKYRYVKVFPFKFKSYLIYPVLWLIHSFHSNVFIYITTVIAHLPFKISFRDSFDKLSQKAQTLNEKGYSAGKEVRLASQHFTTYQNLVKSVRERLRASQMALHEHQALEEALESMWTWVKDVQEKLSSAESTIGSKVILEKRLLQIQVK